jgi:rhodanese-related sulfurtransferase
MRALFDRTAKHPMDRLLEFAAHQPWMVSLAVVMAVLALAYELRARTQDFSAISPMEAVRLMNQGAVLVDVRSGGDFKAAHIGNARNVPGSEIAAGAEALGRFKDKVLITCCDTGMTAGSAARQLARLGFKQVYNLRGGLAAWRQDNLPLVKG